MQMQIMNIIIIMHNSEYYNHNANSEYNNEYGMMMNDE